MNSQPTPPPAPDPTQVASAQQSSNIGTAIGQSYLNNPNVVGPTGSTTFDQTGSYTDPTTGQVIPRFTETQTLGPLGQALLNGQTNVAKSELPAIESMAGGLSPLNINGGANAGIVNGGPQALDQNVSNAVYNEQAGFLNPQWQQQQTNLQDQLSQQGIPLGSDAYNNAMTQFNNQKTQAYQAASNNAIGQGAQIGGQNFGLALQGQQQGVNLQQVAQQNPMQLLSMLTTGYGVA